MDRNAFFLTLRYGTGPIGERAFDLLSNYRPRMAHKIKGTNNDPRINYPAFVEYTKRYW